MDEVWVWLGHSTVLVTERTYAFLTVDDLKRALRRRTKIGTGTTDY